MMSFGISVVVGLLPFLGTVGVPGFAALLGMFPELPFDTARSVVPIAAFLMGTIAASIQFYSTETLSPARMRRAMARTITTTVASLVLLLVVHTFTVERKRITNAQGATSVSILLGFSRLADCQECTPRMSNTECLDYTTLNPVRIRSCWGDRSVNLAFVLLSLLYLSVMGGFGVMVGLGILKSKPVAANKKPPRVREPGKNKRRNKSVLLRKKDAGG